MAPRTGGRRRTDRFGRYARKSRYGTARAVHSAMRCSSSGRAAFSAWPKPGSIHSRVLRGSAAAASERGWSSGKYASRSPWTMSSGRGATAVAPPPGAAAPGPSPRGGCAYAGPTARSAAPRGPLHHPVQPAHGRRTPVLPARRRAHRHHGVGPGVRAGVRRHVGSPGLLDRLRTVSATPSGAADARTGRRDAALPEPPIEKPTVTTCRYPASGPSGPPPPDPAPPGRPPSSARPSRRGRGRRREDRRYPAKTSAVRRSACPSRSRVNPWATTIARSGEPPAAPSRRPRTGWYAASIRTPSDPAVRPGGHAPCPFRGACERRHPAVDSHVGYSAGEEGSGQRRPRSFFAFKGRYNAGRHRVLAEPEEQADVMGKEPVTRKRTPPRRLRR